MFKKLLSNLPFTPSLIGQVAFYAKRLRQEEKLRRTGFILIVLAMAIQIFAVVSPPQPTLAESSNDIIRGGFTTKEQAVLHCLNGASDFYEILTYYGLGCDSIDHAETVNIRSTDYNKQLDSLGRNPQGPTIQRTGKATDEYPVFISGRTYYMKNLWAWDSGAYSTYKVLKMTNKHGQVVMVMYNCGNIITVDKYTPPAPPPPPPAAPPQEPEPPKDVCPLIPDIQLTLEQCDVCPNVPGEQSNTNDCYSCPEARTDTSATACVTFDKKAKNDTQNIADANGTTAKASDRITYTLSVTNAGTIEIKDFVIEENLNDVLEYSDVVDLNGGSLNNEGIVRWPEVDLNPGATITKKVTVKVKDPIPETPASSSDPGSFDLTMTNVFYGKSINIKLPPTIIKTTEQVTYTLPSTGPGTTVAIAVSLTVIVGYFLARSRLLAEELDIVRDDYATSGGH